MAKTTGSAPAAADALLADAAEIARFLWERGWAERNSGSFSLDVTDDLKGARESRPPARLFDGFTVPDLGRRALLLSIPSSRMRDLARAPAMHSGIIRVQDDGAGYRIVSGDPKRLTPSGQVELHCRIQQTLAARKQAERAVLHAHPVGLLAMTQMAEFKDARRLNSVLWGMQPQSMGNVPHGVALVRYLRAGTPELIEAVVEALARNPVVLLEKHGCIAVAGTLGDAFDMIDTLEKSAQVFFTVKSTGRSPEGLSDDQLQDLRLAFQGGSQKLS